MGDKKDKGYDVMLFVLILSLVSGYIGNKYTSPTHLIAFLFAPFALNALTTSVLSKTKPFLVTFFILVSYAFIMLLWVPFPTRHGLGIIRVLIQFLVCFEILVFSCRAENPRRSIALGWLFAALFSSFIGVWEIQTDQHVRMVADSEESIIMNDYGTVFERHIAAVTFYNRNTYCLFLVMALIFILYLFLNEDRLWKRVVQVGLVLVVIYQLFANASRGALLSILVVFFILFLNGIAKRSGSTSGLRRRLPVVLLLIILFVVFYYFGNSLMAYIAFRTEDRGMFEDVARMAVWESTWQCITRSHGLGMGLNSMYEILEQYGSTNLYYSHNMLLEILLVGGVVGLAFFLYFLFRIFKSARRANDKSVKMVLYSVLLAFPLYSIINSENVWPTFIWCFFASLFPFMTTLDEDDEETVSDDE